MNSSVLNDHIDRGGLTVHQRLAVLEAHYEAAREDMALYWQIQHSQRRASKHMRMAVIACSISCILTLVIVLTR